MHRRLGLPSHNRNQPPIKIAGKVSTIPGMARPHIPNAPTASLSVGDLLVQHVADPLEESCG